MDTKALAKSKRAHSLHHTTKKPHHSNQKSKTPSTSTPISDGNKKVREKTKTGLPSNWDRYDEEDEELDTVSKPSDVVLPKSKGADYRHLIAEAQSQSQSYSLPLDALLPGDFQHSLGPMLSVRGEGILSWIGDDNFVVGAETTASHEASFLSLNLHALAEQLAKVDLSERLFIEADLLPPELESKPSSRQESDGMQSESKRTTKVSGELDLKDFSEKNKAVNQNSDIISSASTANDNSDPLSFNQVKCDFNSSQDGQSSKNIVVESSTQFNVNSAVDTSNRVRTFKAAAAEAELDMLLNSFGETKLHDSSGFMSNTLPVSQKEAPIALPQLTRNAPGSSKTTSGAANLDDALDDLLEGTSNSLKTNGMHQRWEVKSAPNEMQSFSTSQSVPKSKVLDDFDSWLDTI